MTHAAAVHPVPSDFAVRAQVNGYLYDEMYRVSITDPEGFWGREGRRLRWTRAYSKVKSVNWDISQTGSPNDLRTRWFEDGLLNVSFNCIDRHLPHLADRAAIIFESDDPEHSRTITYAELYSEVCRFANVLKTYGVERGDRVTIYLPMIPEAVFAMLACARIGAIHSVVSSTFSPDSLAARIADCGSKLLVTADECVKSGRVSPLKQHADAALSPSRGVHCVKNVLVVRRTGMIVPMQAGRDIWFEEAARRVDDECPPEEMGAEDPLFVLHTPSQTGKPRGLVHASGGYLVWASITHSMVFDYRPGEVFWCTADLGWIAGHSYGVYGPLANGATTLMFEGAPAWPDAGRYWRIIDRHQVNIFHTSPSVIRGLMGLGDRFVTETSRSSLRVLGAVGEPIDPVSWDWLYRVVGEKRRPIVDTLCRTEAGGILLTPFPGAHPMKPGSAARPFFGVKPQLIDGRGEVQTGPAIGELCFADSWPGQARTLIGDHARFVASYFVAHPGKFFIGDSARRDADGDYWIATG